MQAQTSEIDIYHDLVTKVYDSVTDPDCWSRSVLELARIYHSQLPSDERLYTDICNIVGVKLSREMFSFLMPHVKKALKLCDKLEEMGQLQQASHQVLDRLGYGVVLLSAQGKPLVTNIKARELCFSSQSVKLDNAGLSALDAKDDTLLQHAVMGALEDNIGSALRLGHEHPLYLLLSPLRNEQLHQEDVYDGARVAVFISVGMSGTSFAANALKGMYGLTKAETRLVTELIKGYSVEEAARKLFVSKNTLRVQLRAVFRKTGAKTQADLMRVLLTGPLTLQDVI